MMNQTYIGFDMRAPDFGVPAGEVYSTALDMVEYADTHGIDAVEVSEHHSVDDGYLPTPFLMAAAIAGRTTRLGIQCGAVLLPLHDPVEVAEQIAVLDLISGGRSRVVLSVGYAEQDFAAFGVSLRERARLMDEGLDVITRALAGERFTYQGRPVFVRPLPPTGLTNVLLGGGVAASARRAARFGLGCCPLTDEVIDVYTRECHKLGREPGAVQPIYRVVHVYDDPEQGWREIGDNLLYYCRSYAEFSTSVESSSSPLHGITTVDALRSSGIINVVTPDEAVEMGRERPISVMPLQGGISPEVGWKSLEMFVQQVLPRLQEGPGTLQS